VLTLKMHLFPKNPMVHYPNYKSTASILSYIICLRTQNEVLMSFVFQISKGTDWTAENI